MAEELHKVGVTVRQVGLNGRTTPFIMWYPADHGPDDKSFDYYGSVSGGAALNAKPDKSAAPYPLIIFSSGFFGCGTQSVFLTEHLAASGFVVAAPDHIDSFFCSSDTGGSKVSYILGGLTKIGSKKAKADYQQGMDLLQSNDWTYRTDDVSSSIDYMFEQNDKEFFNGMIDKDRVGVTGHSLGGWTAFAIGGVEVDCTGMSADEDKNVAAGVEIDLCSADIYKNKKTSLKDPRVKAVLGLSPSVWAYPNSNGEPALDIPSMMITGEKRDIKIEDIKDTYDNVPPPKYEIIIKGVDHLTIVDLLDKNLVTRVVFPTILFNYPEKTGNIQELLSRFFQCVFESR